MIQFKQRSIVYLTAMLLVAPFIQNCSPAGGAKSDADAVSKEYKASAQQVADAIELGDAIEINGQNAYCIKCANLTVVDTSKLNSEFVEVYYAEEWFSVKFQDADDAVEINPQNTDCIKNCSFSK